MGVERASMLPEGVELLALVRVVRKAAWLFAWQVKNHSTLDREDLEQEGLAQIYTALSTYQPGGRAKFTTWAFVVASRAMVKLIASSFGHAGPPELLSAFGSEPAYDDQGIYRILDKDELSRALHCLSEKERHIIALVFTQKKQKQQAAEMLGVTPGMITYHLHQAAKKIQIHLAGEVSGAQRTTEQKYQSYYDSHRRKNERSLEV